MGGEKTKSGSVALSVSTSEEMVEHEVQLCSRSERLVVHKEQGN
uniref:Uncharacterized protein n=1 Tax=Arundo donax TaxID=35708 RepID=A0A0A8ZTT3_ARUDO